MLPPPCLTVGMVPGFLQTWCLAFRPKSSILVSRESCFSWSESLYVLFGNSKRAVMCLFTEEWLPSGHSTEKAWLVACCRDGCPSGRFSHLHRGTLTSSSLPIGFFVTCLTKAFLPRLLSLAGLPALGRVWVIPTFFRLRMMETTVFLGTFNAVDIFWYPSPDLCLYTILFWSSMDNYFDLMTWVLLWHALSTVGPLYRQVFAFPNNVQSIEFATGGLQTSCGNIFTDYQSKQDAPELNLDFHSEGSEYLCK